MSVTYAGLGNVGIPEFLDSDRKSWTLDSERWTLNTKLWTLNAKLWALDSGLLTLDIGLGHATLSLTVLGQNQEPISDSAILNY